MVLGLIGAGRLSMKEAAGIVDTSFQIKEQTYKAIS